MKGHHSRVVHGREDLGLAREALMGLLVNQKPRAQDLDRDLALEVEVERAVDDPHRPGADAGVQPVPSGERAVKEGILSGAGRLQTRKATSGPQSALDGLRELGVSSGQLVDVDHLPGALKLERAADQLLEVTHRSTPMSRASRARTA